MQSHLTTLKQAVFDAISEQIVVLGNEGEILETNAAWNRLQGSTLSAMDSSKDDKNYLEMCKRSRLFHDDEEMDSLCGGVSAVLDGTIPEFEIEYRRLNETDVDRWFALKTTPLSGGGAVLVHQDVTERKMLEREFICISEFERRQVGTKLHDGLCQMLGGMMLTTAVLSSSLKRENSPHAKEMAAVVEMARDATMEARDLSHSLHPVELDSESLPAALEDLVARSSGPANCIFTCEANIPSLNENTVVSLYRIAQESLANALRRKDTKTVTLNLQTRNRHLLLTIEDDGCKSAEASQEHHSMGLQILRYRASAIGARLVIQDRNDKGTRVRCIVSTASKKSRV